MKNFKFGVELYSLLLVVCVACQSNPETKYEQWQGTEYSLAGETIDCHNTLLDPAHLCFFDDYVALNMPNDPKMFTVFRVNDNQLQRVSSFLDRGRGPKEVQDAYLYYLEKQNKLSVVGYNYRGKSLIIPTDSIENLSNQQIWTVVDYPQMIGASQMLPMSDSTYIVCMYQDANSLFALFNSSTGMVSNLAIPYPDDMQVSYLNKSKAYGVGVLAKRPGFDQFAYSHSESHFITIVSIRDSTITQQKNLFGPITEYSMKSNDELEMPTFKKPRSLGFQIFTSKRHLYIIDPKVMVPNMQQSAAENGYPVGFFQEIMVADWQGKPVAKYKLDQPIVYGQVDPTDSYLYGFTTDTSIGGSQLVRFRLPIE